ncbi:Tryptophan 2,3-dioxygenase apoenzyme (EC 1.13.11.11) [Streptoalloteichus tenebrarius]|uniref:Tryptophan 2,3-dioxygenase n=1 Tax=Streptoalloteichus tenebrarius (strain ATCC 17920 / DSM 40477 / JCM 4838 / CBS 697.72 / NBRC 16177 / NCIMB 11028 / NRRL B-12390 / A12253. 1 / ISP 5477) TaxID=1933 RepID=A0ABT1HYT2_STRSD|nr:tryptophan 2,3-dioxygenase family protein [Streptoalloteichus tenebrarius]MCP2260687.1 Tryptophan 2,3-dioxygenase apoenzyme (EC 1.13.11.11) [Streptoalloteichus tenebrarius]BFF03780.1 tryptophan 2,3-dioxygenase family protein [Streptoalloteichus tenebrarius]
MSEQSAALTYTSYLALDEVLGAQRPRSAEHDEMLFIVIHQVYELWFKQVLHELAHLQRRLEAGDTTHAAHTLRRVLRILKVAVAQIDVLETMTPRQFLSFRARLEASSGFQSAQFRELEAVLGRRDDNMLRPYAEDSPARARIAAAMARPSLFDSFLRYLTAHGYQVPVQALRRDVRRPLEPSPAVQRVLLAVYRDDNAPAEVAEHLIDLDEGLQEWRYRHVKMVERTIGAKTGTGGSAGAAYLRTTLFRPVFPDLWAVRSEL